MGTSCHTRTQQELLQNMSAGAGRRTLAQLYRQGWHEIPEVMASSYLAVIGLGFMAVGSYIYIEKNGDNRRYRIKYTVIRKGDEREKTVKE